MVRDKVGRKTLRTELGVSAPTVSDWLSGKILDLKGENLSAICDYFNVAPNEFLNCDLSAPVSRIPGLITHSSGAGKTLHAIRLLQVLYKLEPNREGYFAMSDSPAGLVPSATGTAKAYGVQIDTDDLRPRYKRREVVIADPAVAYEPGDEVVVRLADGRTGLWCFDRARDGLLQFRHVSETSSPFTVDSALVESCHKVIGMAQPDTLVKG